MVEKLFTWEFHSCYTYLPGKLTLNNPICKDKFGFSWQFEWLITLFYDLTLYLKLVPH